MSIRWMGVVAWAVSILALWAILTPGVLSSTGLIGFSLAGLMFLVILLTAPMRSIRTVAQVLADTEAEPVLVAATSAGGDAADVVRGSRARGEDAR